MGRPAKASRLAAGLIDPGTGWYAAWYFHLRLDEEVARAARYGRPLSLLGLSLTRSGGALSKERWRLLSQLSELAFDGLRASDIAGVLGRFSYAVILPETAPEGAQILAERLEETLEEFAPKITVVSFPDDGRRADDLLGAIEREQSVDERAG